MITKKEVGIALKEKVANREPLVQIGEWSFRVYWDNISDSEMEVKEILLTLTTLELGEEFARSYELLDRIADDLIAEKDVEMW